MMVTQKLCLVYVTFIFLMSTTIPVIRPTSLPPPQSTDEEAAKYSEHHLLRTLEEAKFTCTDCQMAFTILAEKVAEGTQSEEIMKNVIDLCVMMGVQNFEICEAMVHSFGHPILYILHNRPDLTADDFCSLLNPHCTPPIPGNQTRPSKKWKINIDPDENKPPLKNVPPLPVTGPSNPIKILQLTDLHIDLNYTIGTNANCDSPLCCRQGAAPASDEDAAQLYGDHRCPLPVLAYDAILEHARSAHGVIKYIFLTGDYVHNGIWFYSPEENGRHIRYVTEKIVQIFPHTPIYPMTGNHEPAPVNLYPPQKLWSESSFDLKWMYEVVAAPFSKWLGHEALTTFKKGGFYTVRPQSGLRLVILNTNLCYKFNLWLLYEQTEALDQLQWLADTLLMAEREGDGVYILGHIRPGLSDCWPVWSDFFEQILNRFEGTVKGQFYGHQHIDNFYISLEYGTERPMTVAFEAPSAVPDDMSSAYKIFLVDGDRQGSTWDVLDHETWILNTSLANWEGTPVFKKLYGACEAYGLKSVRADALYDFILTMLNDDQLFLQFQRNQHKGATMRSACNPADVENFQDCKIKLLCDSITSKSGDTSHCDRLHEIVYTQN